ncbi:unnamed protein product [Onchocerca flexuosa]|uniref:Ovule protein n=1 Tax=Onchocerca flexuosa TaxID=387005 RepID=A0A183HA40_9BILA|nr:unnamed protein product [Onchocerca flexuosa]
MNGEEVEKSSLFSPGTDPLIYSIDSLHSNHPPLLFKLLTFTSIIIDDYKGTEKQCSNSFQPADNLPALLFPLTCSVDRGANDYRPVGLKISYDFFQVCRNRPFLSLWIKPRRTKGLSILFFPVLQMQKTKDERKRCYFDFKNCAWYSCITNFKPSKQQFSSELLVPLCMQHIKQVKKSMWYNYS